MSNWPLDEFRASGGLSTVVADAPDSLYLTCASYEPRTLAMAESLASDYRAEQAVVYVHSEFRGAGLEGPPGRAEERLKAALEDHCPQVRVAVGSWLNPTEQVVSLREALRPLQADRPAPATITIDTTTFTREALLTAVGLLRTHCPGATIRVLYVSACEYGAWLSRGFRCVRNVVGLPGVHRPVLPTLLAVLSGFEAERTTRLIDEHEPGKVLVGVGDPATGTGFLERNLVEQQAVLARQEVERFTFPANDIGACWTSLEEVLYPYFGHHNVVIAPMSTKLSTIAAFLVAERHPEVQVTYSVPAEYNMSQYSSGSNEVYVDSIPPCPVQHQCQ